MVATTLITSAADNRQALLIFIIILLRHYIYFKYENRKVNLGFSVFPILFLQVYIYIGIELMVFINIWCAVVLQPTYGTIILGANLTAVRLVMRSLMALTLLLKKRASTGTSSQGICQVFTRSRRRRPTY